MDDKRGINHDVLIEHIWNGHIVRTLDATPMEGMTRLQDGQALQLDMLDRYCTRGESLAGWKVGMTSGKSRDALGKGVRPFGFILRNRVIKTNDTLHIAAITRCAIENEVCFVMGEHLKGDAVTAKMAREAVYGFAPAFEIIEQRIEGQADDGIRVADNLSQWGIVIGKLVIPVPDDFDFDGLEVVRKVARGHIDDHFESLAALVRELAKFDLGLRDGQHIITGSLTRQSVTTPGRWEATFSNLGSVAINFV
jgi:2-keto-4-pentenoate hydratase